MRDNDRDFINGVDYGLSLAAADRQLDYVSMNADNSAESMVEHLREMQARQVGGLVTAPVDPMKSAPILQELLRAGTYVGTIVPPPATTILNAPQYLTGKVLAEAAAAHIRDTMQGRANVVLLTHDSMQFLSPRFAAMRDVFREMPEVAIVADISPVTVTEKGGYDTMTNILIAEPQIDVVLGADTVVLGALAALRDTGMARPDQFVGGIDGEREAVAELSQPDSPYKTSISLASAIFGYAMGQHAADWIEGKSIPKAIDVLPFALTAENVEAYRADMADPAKVYADQARLASYLAMYGNTCIGTKDEYVNFPWSSETRF
ncbi:sugar ABC transporter substrate-binding protein [Rhodobacter sp. SY28-1]|uniref:sugar ABC transporter substrate-binding protein n=1 Tax=Rhodobacter sp. SY28-1 TaxID=2562317 RepID=UPI0019808565|nr:sugar ABC transporter substrate-binding protein [Rhodobacter sp. SY28-1]